MATNYDRIRNMSVDEIAEILLSTSSCGFCIKNDEQNCNLPCEQGIKQWLESEADE